MHYPRIKNLREDLELKQKEVANALHIAQRTYSHYEVGDREVPVDILYALCDFYGVTPEYLTGRSDIKMPARSEVETYPSFKTPALILSEKRAAIKASRKNPTT